MIEYFCKKKEKKHLEERMKLFEENYIIKAKGEQNLTATTENETIYISPGYNTTIEEVISKGKNNSTVIKATKDSLFIKIKDQMYKLTYTNFTV